jgi:hypothetical protein
VFAHRLIQKGPVKGATRERDELRFRASYSTATGPRRGRWPVKISTSKFAQLLRDAQKWDEKYPQLCHAQVEYLLTEFCYGDAYCIFANRWDRQAWDVPHVAGNRLFTRCDWYVARYSLFHHGLYAWRHCGILGANIPGAELKTMYHARAPPVLSTLASRRRQEGLRP